MKQAGSSKEAASDSLDSALHASDRSLLQRIQEGSQDAATSLYLRYVDRLRSLARAQCSPDLARRVEIDDLVQSVFGSFFRGATQGFYDVPAGEELWKLFLVIALNKIRARGAYHRAAKRDVRQTTSTDGVEWALEDPHHDDAERLLRLSVSEALSGLPDLQRRVVELRIEGFEVAEIASRVGRSKRTTERTLQDARKKLSRVLEEQADDGHGTPQRQSG